MEAENWQSAAGWVLGESGEGEEWMRRLEREREEMGRTEIVRGRREGGSGGESEERRLE